MRPSRRRTVARRFATVAAIGLVVAAFSPGFVLAKVPGTNGAIAYDWSDPDGNGHIIVLDPDGTRHEISAPWPGGLPVWSPDATHLLLSVFVDDGPPQPAIVAADGSDPHLLPLPALASDFALICRAWSPDGTRLLCQGDSFADPSVRAVYSIRALDGGDVRRLTWGAFPPVVTGRGTCGVGDLPGDYSPDGSEFVFTRAKCGAGPMPDHDQSAAIFVAKVDGSDPRQLTPFGLAWSHDEGLARWSPDGRLILFAGAHGDLFTVQPDGSHLKQIPLGQGDARAFAFAPDWSPDGKRIVTDLFLGSAGDLQLYTANADGSHLQRLTNDAGFVDDANWGIAR